MKDVDFLEQEINIIGGENGWWKDRNREIFMNHGMRLLGYGVPVDIVALILEDLYNASIDEYGI